ncbi:MAG: DUF4440 domain-containing protein [Gammaproteobacteria bacterium]|nr:DUF4440 domain-containing protein [Gammaproteobacteria bacterium]
MNMRQFFAVCLVSGLAFSANAGDEEALREFKTVLWPEAYRNQDVELLDRMLHDSFVVITDSGTVSTKQDELDFLKENDWDPGEFEYRIDRLDIYESNFAIISGRGFAEDYSYTSSNVLVKQGGRWQAIGSHVSGVERMNAAKDAAFFAISVSDIERSIAWYENNLGFTVTSQGSNEQRKGALLSRAGAILEIAEFHDAISLDQLRAEIESHEVFGIFKLGFTASDLDAEFQRLQGAGVDIFFPIINSSDGNRTFGVRDVDGNIVQFFGR